MRYTRCGLILLVLLAVLSSGCRLPGREGPVPKSLADCRRLSQRGVAEMERGRQQASETLLAQAVTACPVDAEARRNYAESLWLRDARSEAIAQMEEAVRLAEEDAPFAVRLAEMYLADGRVKLAQQSAESAIEIDPTSARAWAIRGGALRAIGSQREALADYLRALSLSPDDRDVMLTVAELYGRLNQPRRSLQALQELAETYSPGEEPGRVMYLQGLAYVALGRNDDGVECLTAAVTRGQPTAEMYCSLGEAQFRVGRFDEAAAAGQRALELQPDCTPGRDLLQRIEVARRQDGRCYK